MNPHQERPEWMDFAACRDMDGDLFFPARGEDVSAAKAVCRTCVVRPTCLAYALEHDEYWGIWGGTSARQRQQLRMRMRRCKA